MHTIPQDPARACRIPTEAVEEDKMDQEYILLMENISKSFPGVKALSDVN